MAVGKGVLTTCNYHARKFGCRSGMAGFVAMKLCPSLICLPLNFDKYTAKAMEVREILADYDSRFESASIDEAYLNITTYCQDHEMEAEDVVSQLRARVEEDTKITVSAGIAPNAKIAKICSNRNKPNGQFRVASNRQAILSFMHDLPTRKVNGVGRVFERELQGIGIKTCGEIYEQRAILPKLFGEKAFQFLIQSYLGLGRTIVRPAEEYQRKSVGTESTFREMSDKFLLREKLRWTAEELEKDLSRTQFKGRTVVLKIKLHTYEVLTRQVATPKAVHSADDLFDAALPMFSKLEREIPTMKLRLMGLRCTHLVSTKRAGIDFFGMQRTLPAHPDITGKDLDLEENGIWETWPETEFEAAARQERHEEMNEVEQLSQEYNDQSPEVNHKHGKEILPNPGKNVTSQLDTFWNCPICDRAQSANDKKFNDHIDNCLSRRTIREVVHETVQEDPSVADVRQAKLVRSQSISALSTLKRRSSINAKLDLGGGQEKRRRFFGRNGQWQDEQ